MGGRGGKRPAAAAASPTHPHPPPHRRFLLACAHRTSRAARGDAHGMGIGAKREGAAVPPPSKRQKGGEASHARGGEDGRAEPTEPVEFTFRGVTFRLGDCIALLPPYEGAEAFIGRIEGMRTPEQAGLPPQPQGEGAGVSVDRAVSSQGTEVAEIYVRWFYRPEETHCGRKCFHSDRELFVSDHHDWEHVKSVNYKCNVHTLRQWMALERKPPGDHFTRFDYSARTRTFKPDRVPIYCVCEMPFNPDFFMAECKACHEWYHPQCIGCTVDAVSVKGWKCPECLKEGT